MERIPGLSPYLLRSLRGYGLAAFRRDLLAGSMVGIIALPLAMAFAIASGVPPSAGLYTAIVAGFLISALGGSRVQIGGPTGAFVVIIYAAIEKHGIENLGLCTMLAGIVLVLLGVSGLGRVVKYVPYPVTKGFTAGIALIIISGQIKNFLALPIERLPADFLGQWGVYARELGGRTP